MTNGMTPNPEPTVEAEENNHLRNITRWLLLIPIVLVTLLCCGQLALYGISPPAAKDTGSHLEADYGVWPFVVIPRVLPEIISEIRHDRGGVPDEVIVPGQVWPLLPLIPTDEPVPQNTPTIEPASSATPEPEQPTLTPTVLPTSTASPTITPTPTEIWVWIPSNTPFPTSPPTATDIPDPTATSTFLPTATTVPSETPSQTPVLLPTITDTPIPSLTPTETPTPSLTPTDTPTITDTPTPSLTPSDTPTPTDTLTPSLTPTETPDLCPGSLPPGEPNIGPSNNVFAEIPCGGSFLIDLVAQGDSPVDTTIPDPDFDIRYYERTVPGDATRIAFDFVTLMVGTGPSGSCGTGTWYTAMVWGDGDSGNNGHLGGSYPENDNERIPTSALHGGPFQTGISMDLDALGIPNQEYPCILIISPVNWPDNDGSEVDAIEILP